MIDLKIQLGTSGYLDLDKDLPVSLNFSIAEIQDISKKNSSYSKTVYLPGTKNNNKLLGHYFDINLADSTFDINRKNTVVVLADGLPVLKGFMQLLSIKKQSPTSTLGEQDISYEVSLFDSKVNFYDKLGNEELTDLDLSRFNHSYYWTTILSASANTWQQGYTYPLYNNYSNSVYETCDFRPSIFVKTYVDQMFEDAGYTYTSSFFESEPFTRLVVPYNGDWPSIGASAQDLRQFQASITGATTNYVRKFGPGGLSANTMSAITTTAGVLIPFNDDSSLVAGNYDSGNTYSTTLYKWVCPNVGIYDFNLSFNGTFIYSAATNGWRFSDNPGVPNGGQVPNTSLTGYARLLKNGTVVATKVLNNIAFTPTRTYYGLFGTQGFSTSFGPDISGGTVYSFNVSCFQWNTTLGTSSNLLVPGDYVEVSLAIDNPYMDYYKDGNKYSTWTGTTGAPGNNINGTGWPAPSNKIPVTCAFRLNTGQTTANRYYNFAHTSGVLSDLDTVAINDFVPKKIKKKDFFAGLVQMFNLYIEQDPDNETNLIIKTRDEYFSASTSVDWTYKISHDKEQSIKFLSELQNKKLVFSYTQDESNQNLKDYKFNTNFVYGEQDVEFDNDFLTGEKKITPLFAPTCIVKNGQGNIVSDIDSRAPKNTIRILYCASGLFSGGTNSGWSYKHIVTGGTSASFQTTTHSGYVWAGHLDDPIYPSLDLNFGSNEYVFYNELSAVTNNTLYMNYWYTYVDQIANGKLLTAYFNLESKDIMTLRFSDKIFIKDAFYYINKIQDFNAINKQLTKVELLKVNDGLRNSPTRTRRSFVNMAGSQFANQSTLRAANSNGGGSISGGLVEGGNDVFSRRAGVVIGEENTIQEGARTNITSGFRNTVDGNNVVILNGSGNTVNANNAILINTNNKTVTEDGVLWLNGILIKNGVMFPAWNNIEGGSNEVWSSFGSYVENNIDAGLNQIRATGSTTSFLSNIEGGQDSTNQ